MAITVTVTFDGPVPASRTPAQRAAELAALTATALADVIFPYVPPYAVTPGGHQDSPDGALTVWTSDGIIRLTVLRAGGQAVTVQAVTDGMPARTAAFERAPGTPAGWTRLTPQAPPGDDDEEPGDPFGPPWPAVAAWLDATARQQGRQ